MINLGSGKRWLSSRLYLLTVLLTRTRELKTVVFLATQQGIPERFVGLADAEALARILAARQPWLEYRLIEAYGPYMKQHADDSQSRAGAWTEEQAAAMFVQGIQQTLPAGSTAQDEQNFVPGGWVSLKAPPGQKVLEDADWLSAESLIDLVDDTLDRVACVVERALVDTESRNRAVLGLKNRDDLVVVDDQRQFRGRLIRRRDALEQLAAQAADTP